MEPASEADRYFQRMQPLGPFRGQVLACTGSENPRSPFHFDPPEGADLNAAFREHLELLWDPEVTKPQYSYMSVVAAGLLSYGRLEMAGYILDDLPDHPVRNGYCNTVARRVVVAVLPLPEGLRAWESWVAGTPEAEAVRSWYTRHRGALRWQPPAGPFALVGDGVTPA